MREPVCPVPLSHDTVQLAHGGGGARMQELLRNLVWPALSPEDEEHTDAAVLALAGPVAFTTDTFVVTPRFFPGGDLGSLAVYGTINDLACAGAVPVALSVALLLEEGLPFAELERLLLSMRAAADRCGVRIVTGDTKVVDRGKADGVFVTTSGVGRVPAGVDLRPSRLRPGDAVLVSGDVGRHGIAVLSQRQGLTFATPVQSDCGPVHDLAAALVGAGLDLRCLRDPTRGGLGAVLHELATAARLEVVVDEPSVPVHPGVAEACEVLGLEPFSVACEGRLVVVVGSGDAERALAVLRSTPGGEGAALVGVCAVGPPRVVVHTALGTSRLLDLPVGEQLPRIC